MSPAPLRAHLVALAVALHLAAVLLQAVPAPSGGMNRSTWKDPTVQGEFRAWSERLGGLGLELSPRALEDGAWAFAQRFMAVRSEVLAPFKPYYRYAGVVQSWRMFVAPHRFPTRLEIAVHQDGQWRTVYRERDPEAAWRGRWLDHDRFRSAIFRFGWKPYRRTYESFARWVARYAAQDFPDADGVRVRLMRSRTRSPEQVRAGEPLRETPVEVITHELAPLRAPAAQASP